MGSPYEEMGYQLALYIGAAGATAATQITGAEDVDYEITPQKGATTDRGTGGNVPITTENVAQLGVQITWKQHVNQNDTTLTTLIAAAKTGLPVAIKLVTLAGATIFDGDCTLQKKYNAPLADTASYDFTATPTKQAGRIPTLG